MAHPVYAKNLSLCNSQIFHEAFTFGQVQGLGFTLNIKKLQFIQRGTNIKFAAN